MESPNRIHTIFDGEVKVQFTFHQLNSRLTTGYHFVGLFTLGIGYLIIHWMPSLYIRYFSIPMSDQIDHDIVLHAKNEWGQSEVIQLQHIFFNGQSSNAIPNKQLQDTKIDYLDIFEYRHKRYLYYNNEIINQEEWSNFNFEGLDSNTVHQRSIAFGLNTIVVPNPTVLELLINEILHPFYIFQIFSILLWLVEYYIYYATCIFFISAISIAKSLYDTKSNIQQLEQLAKSSISVNVNRDGVWTDIDASQLVLGDIYKVPLHTIPADSLLLQGQCVVDECMLTGESVPVTKSATVTMIPLDMEHPMLNLQLQKHLIYNGTQVLQAQQQPIALVIRTGYKTCKGMLIRSILHPKPQSFKFYRDSIKFIIFLSCVAFIGFIYSCYQFISANESIYVILIASLDLITIAVPPALVSTLSIGISFGLSRLRKLDIYCISPARINVAGQVNFILFDKTGTLTINNLILRHVLEMHNNGQLIATAPSDAYNVILSSCHSLTLINQSLNGDPLELEMFHFTKSTFLDPTTIKYNNSDIHIIKSYEFDPNLRRMTVLVQYKDKYMVCCKGAPESIKDICTVINPSFDTELQYYSHRGYRVLACCMKYVDNPNKMSRLDLEQDLQFMGFLVFENALKKETAATINTLHDASLSTAMCTGDNLLTAIAVAKECNILNQNTGSILKSSPHGEPSSDIELQQLVQASNNSNYTLCVPEYANNDLIWRGFDSDFSTTNPLDFDYLRFAIDGQHFEILKSIKSFDYIAFILQNCSIFARMTPDQKKEIVEHLQKYNNIVLFCGDGANDCAALKASDVGLSLSDAEASIAAPFTSKNFEISCVLELIKEGRAALVTSFGCFKYMALYSMTQFCTVIILYSLRSNLSDFQFLFIDLFLVLPLAISMAYSKPCNELHHKSPQIDLLSVTVVVPLLLQIMIQGLLQLGMYYIVEQQPFYKPSKIDFESKTFISYESTSVFMISNFIYISYAVVYFRGKPFREPIYKSGIFTGALCMSVLVAMLILMTNAGHGVLELNEMPMYFKFVMIAYSVGVFGVIWSGEKYGYPWIGRLVDRIRKVNYDHGIVG